MHPPSSLLLSQSEKKVKLLQKNDLLLVAYLRPVRTSKQNPQKVKKYEFIHRKAEFFYISFMVSKRPQASEISDSNKSGKIGLYEVRAQKSATFDPPKPRPQNLALEPIFKASQIFRRFP